MYFLLFSTFPQTGIKPSLGGKYFIIIPFIAIINYSITYILQVIHKLCGFVFRSIVISLYLHGTIIISCHLTGNFYRVVTFYTQSSSVRLQVYIHVRLRKNSSANEVNTQLHQVICAPEVAEWNMQLPSFMKSIYMATDCNTRSNIRLEICSNCYVIRLLINSK